MDLVIKNGTIVTATETYKADIGCQNGEITSIGKEVKGDQKIDAEGLYVFPGAVDMHTHLDMPFGGSVSSDDFYTGTVAAACGGTTTIIDFAIQTQGSTLKEALDTWMKKAEGKAVTDYGFHVAITDLPPERMKEIPQMVEQGVTSFKLFLAYKGALMVDDATFYQALKMARKYRALICVHAENGDVIDVLIKNLLKEGKTEPYYHAVSRPNKAEGEATFRAIALAEMAEAPIYIVHLTCAEALEKVRFARDKGLPVYAETCPQYLLLDVERYKEPNFNGAKYVMSPPLREAWNQELLWDGLKSGDLQVISTDHCPFNFTGQKDMGKDDFSKIPNGAPGIETRIPLLYTEGVVKGQFSVNKMVELTATNPARLFGLLPEKGTIAVGADADIVLFDPKKEVTLRQSMLHQNVDYTPYEGMKVTGYPVKTIVAGKVVVDNGEFIGEKGTGKYIKRKQFHRL
ncbi:MAG: dihydropyrimidinase [Theionarchaea archaeon]|nr:MAG: phenylhydantoinase [Theionarchaea archaeon DG-70]MBU7012467.1 dihydropyrimidinase [Theionarchaea archaeon]